MSSVWRAVRSFLTPAWLAFHLTVWVAVVTMVLLGRWQLAVSNRKHFDLQNFSYVVQWWLFAGFAVVFWARVIRDKRRPPKSADATGGELVLRSPAAQPLGQVELVAPTSRPEDEPVVYRGYRMPQNATTPYRTDGDPALGAYNDYLWQLSLADAAKDGRRLPRLASPAAAQPRPSGEITGRPVLPSAPESKDPATGD